RHAGRGQPGGRSARGGGGRRAGRRPAGREPAWSVAMSHVLAAPAATTTREFAFWILAILAVTAGLGMILARRAVHCAVLLAVVMLSLAVLYAMLGAPFLAFVQIIVYTGAVLMLFLFVIMLIGISSSDSVVETIKGQRAAA